MGTLRRAFMALALTLGAAGVAHADAKGDITSKSKEAMENYDMMDYGAAKKLLNQALAAAKKAKLDKDPVTAKIYLHLGIAAFADNDPDGALVDFQSAIEIDPKIQIEAAYKSPELTKLLEQARSGAGGSDGGTTEPATPDDGVDCAAVKGLQHTIIDSAKGGKSQPIEALLGADVSPTKVVVAFRAGGATDFTEVKLSKQGECKYTGSIPASAMHGDIIQYYVAALGDNGKPVASRGSAGAPNLVDIEGGGGGGGEVGDNEDPINGGGGGGGGGGEITKHTEKTTITGGKAPKVYVSIVGGTGGGYVTGQTEQHNTVQNCCIGASLVVLTPELGFYANRKLSIGVAGRFGIPIGADMTGHSTVAPGALVRVRYALGADGGGLRVMGQIGGGVMRDTVKVDNPMTGTATDIVPQGPLLIGAGLGYLKRLSNNVAFQFDVSVLGAIAVVDKLGTSVMNSGVGADASLGLSFGF